LLRHETVSMPRPKASHSIWAEEEAVPLTNDAVAWRTHPRLQRHAEVYASHSNRCAVLDRYAKNAVGLERQTLLRCICHVAAWVALLPNTSVTAVGDKSQKSPVLLLTQLLRMRGKGKLTPWLQGVLRLVSARLHHSSHAACGDAADKAQWKDLRSAMPTGLMSEHSPGKRKTEADARSLISKRCRLFSNEIAVWRNCETVQEIFRMQQLEVRFVEIFKTEPINAVLLRAMIRQLAAALSSPRALPSHLDSSAPMDAAARERIKTLSRLQRSARRMLRQAVNVWSKVLCLETEQIEPMLSHVRLLIEDFEQRLGNVETHACAGKQWGLLKLAVSPEPDALPVIPLLSGKSVKHSSPSCEQNGVYRPNDRIAGLRWVEHRDEACVLKCSSCEHQLSSSWYFVYGGTARVLRPQKKHASCGGVYHSDDVASVTDCLQRIDICEHNRRRSRCFECGGVEICEHRNEKWRCQICLSRRTQIQAV